MILTWATLKRGVGVKMRILRLVQSSSALRRPGDPPPANYYSHNALRCEGGGLVKELGYLPACYLRTCSSPRMTS